MINEMLLKNLQNKCSPLSESTVNVCGSKLPDEFAKLLRVANGFLTANRLFRIFGTKRVQGIPSLTDWNNAEWKKQYGALASGLLFVAEDIFGDQYGYRFASSKTNFVKFHCEGGSVGNLSEGLDTFIQAITDPFSTQLIDTALINQAFAAGLKPAPEEHLAFRVPLVVGGNYTVTNLGVEPAELHLGVLAQISTKNVSLSEGTQIKRFSS